MSPRLRRLGGIVVHVAAALYMFAALSIICEDYFVPALEVICDEMHVSKQSAHAARASSRFSMPRFEAIIRVLSIPLASYGSARERWCSQALGRIAVKCSTIAQVVVLHRWPMYRDSVFFLASVVILLVALQDEEISQLESVLLLVTYGIYAVFMGFDAKAEEFFLHHLPFLRDQLEQGSGTTPTTALPATLSASALGAAQEGVPPGPLKLELPPTDGRRPSHGLVLMPSRRESQAPGQLSLGTGTLQGLRADASARAHSLDVTSLRQIQSAARRRSLAADPNRRRISLISLRSSNGPASSVCSLKPPQGALNRLAWLLLLPLTVLLHFTVPDCKQDRWRKWFGVTFVMSTLHISVFSYLLVWTITIIGE
ncbi:unnamed protein product [Ixodes hexagonus]